jgi:hypothetical protein
VHGEGVGEVRELQRDRGASLSLRSQRVVPFLGEEQPGLVDELLRFFSPEFVKETVLGHVVKESPIGPA